MESTQQELHKWSLLYYDDYCSISSYYQLSKAKDPGLPPIWFMVRVSFPVEKTVRRQWKSGHPAQAHLL